MLEELGRSSGGTDSPEPGMRELRIVVSCDSAQPSSSYRDDSDLAES